MDSDKKIGVALGGGGVAGLAAIGVIEELRAAGIPLQCAAGTSAGAAVGAAFSSGRFDLFREEMIHMTRSRFLTHLDPVWPRTGLLEGRRAMGFIDPFVGERIEQLDKPFAAVAADLDSGEEIVLDRGPVREALRASMALPGIFTPASLGGRLLVDGGLVNPVPVSVARRLGADFVIAVSILPLDEPGLPAPAGEEKGRHNDVATPALAQRKWRETAPGILDILAQGSRLVQAAIARARFRDDPPDFLIRPLTDDIGLFDFGRIGEAIEAGRAAAKAAVPHLHEALRASHVGVAA